MVQRVGRGIALLFHDRGTDCSAACPGRNLPPGKTQYQFYRRLGGPQGRSGRAEYLDPTGIRTRTVQPVAQSLYRLSYWAHSSSLACSQKSTVPNEQALLIYSYAKIFLNTWHVISSIIIIIIIIISFMQGIYTNIPETNNVPREYNVAAILLLLFMVLISLVSVLNLLYFYISTFRSMCAVPNMAVCCSSLTSCFPVMLLTYFLNEF